VPLKARGQVIGVLNVSERIAGGSFGDSDLSLLLMLASQAAIAIDNARLLEAQARKLQELSALYEVGRALTSSLERDQTLRLVLQNAMELLAARHGSLMLVDETSQFLEIVAARGLSDAIVRQARPRMGEGIAGLVAGAMSMAAGEYVSVSSQADTENADLARERGELASTPGPDLPFLDKLIYRYVLIPITKKRLLEREKQFQWVYHKEFPLWGRGRDDAMNLTKYFLLDWPMDDSIGPTDIPSIWNLKKYKPEKGMLMNLAGDSHDARSVIIDSALGLLAAAPHNSEDFRKQVDWLVSYLSEKQAPKFPFAIDEKLAASGKAVFAANCARCHASERTGTRVPVEEVGTDRERLKTWSKKAAVESNKVVRNFGIERRGLVENEPSGYIAAFLDGIWLRAPYLHNGSVPSLRDLLKPAAERPKVFYRGYDVYDPVNVGFVTEGEEAERVGTRYDVSERASGNQGHEYGTNLSAKEKDALIEYLKTL
jgi:cytochrome c553